MSSFSSFEGLLSKEESVTVHERNLQILATDMCKILNSSSPEIMKGIFETKINYYITLNAYWHQELGFGSLFKEVFLKFSGLLQIGPALAPFLHEIAGCVLKSCNFIKMLVQHRLFSQNIFWRQLVVGTYSKNNMWWSLFIVEQ